MKDILDIFAEKLIQNLMSSAESTQDEHRRIVDQTLDVMAQYLMNSASCRKLAELEVIKQLATSHIS